MPGGQLNVGQANVGQLVMAKRCDFRAMTRTAETADAGACLILAGLLLLSAP